MLCFLSVVYLSIASIHRWHSFLIDLFRALVTLQLRVRFPPQVSPAASRECGKTRKTSKAPGLPEAIPSGSFTVGQCKAWRHRWEMSLSSFIEDTKGSNMMISLPLQFINQLLVHVYHLHRHFQDMLFFTNPCAPWELNLRPCCC